MIEIYNKNRAYLLFFLPLVALIAGVLAIANAVAPPVADAMPFYNIVSFIIPDFAVLSALIAFIILIFQAVMTNMLANNNEIQKNTFVPSLLFVILAFNNVVNVSVSPILWANLIMIVAFNQILRFSKEGCSYDVIFNAGFFISIASLFYLPALFIFPLAIIGVYLFRSDYLRENFIVLSGLLTPYCFVFFYYFWTDNLVAFTQEHFAAFFSMPAAIQFDPAKNGYYIGLAAIFVISFVHFLSGISMQNIKLRKNKSIIAWYIVFLVVGHLFSGADFFSYMAMYLLPFSIILSQLFIDIKKGWMTELLFWLLFLGSMYNMYESCIGG